MKYEKITLIMAIIFLIVVILLIIRKVEAAPMQLEQEARCYVLASSAYNADNAKKHRIALRQYRKIKNHAVNYHVGFAQGFLTATAQIYKISPNVIAKSEYKAQCEVES